MSIAGDMTNGESKVLAGAMMGRPPEEILSFVLVVVREHGKPGHRCIEVSTDEEDSVLAMGVLASAGVKIATTEMEHGNAYDV